MSEILFFLVLSAFMFTCGLAGVVVRKNPLVIFMSIELMLNASVVGFVTMARFGPEQPYITLAQGSGADGPVFGFIIMTIAAAEAVVGLALIIMLFRRRRQIDVDKMDLLKG